MLFVKENELEDQIALQKITARKLTAKKSTYRSTRDGSFGQDDQHCPLLGIDNDAEQQLEQFHRVMHELSWGCPFCPRIVLEL